MRHCRNSIKIMGLIFLLFPLLCTPSAVAQSAFYIEESAIEVYRDGIAHIKQTFSVDEFVADIQIPLLGTAIENVLILDQDKKPVDYQINATRLIVFTFGASALTLEYDTNELTNKNADVWTLIVNSPYDIEIRLPQNSTIIYLNGVPRIIDTSGDDLILTLDPAAWEVSYILPLQQENQNPAIIKSEGIVQYTIAGILGTFVISILSLFLIRKRRITIKKTLKRNPNLTKDEIGVLEFLVKKDGKAFEAEIRQHFPDMPRTSLWRLVRRLEGLEVVEIKRIGLENQVQLRK